MGHKNTRVYYDGPILAFTGELDPTLSGLAGYKIEMIYANARNVVFRNNGQVQSFINHLYQVGEDPPYTNDVNYRHLWFESEFTQRCHEPSFCASTKELRARGLLQQNEGAQAIALDKRTRDDVHHLKKN